MIKEVERKHVEACATFIRYCFKTVADMYCLTEENAKNYVAFSLTKSRLEFELDNENRKIYAYYLDGKVVGLYSFCLKLNNKCEINYLCVDPEHRNKGIGRALLYHAIENAEENFCTKIETNIMINNTPLRQWLINLGFHIVKTERVSDLVSIAQMKKNIDLRGNEF